MAESVEFSGNYDGRSDFELDAVGQEGEPSWKENTGERKRNFDDANDGENDANIGQEVEPTKNEGNGKRKMVPEEQQECDVCNYCKRKLTRGSKSGTIHLKNHMRSCCPAHFCPAKQNYQFDQTESENKLAKLIILEEWNSSIVYSMAFRDLLSSLQPEFKIPHKVDLERFCRVLFVKERQKILKRLRDNKYPVSVAVDIIKAGSNENYLLLAVYFIHFPETCVERLVLNCVELDESCSGDALIQLIEEKLREWNLDKNLFSIVSPYPITSNEYSVHELHSALAPKKSVIFGGGAFHVQSCTQVINFIIRGCMKALQAMIEKVREGVKWIKASPKNLQGFELYIQHDVATVSQLFDCLSEENSIFRVLSIARKFGDACASLNVPFPSSREWENVESIMDCLQVCYEIRKLSSTIEDAATSLYFPKLCELYLLVREYCSRATQFTASVAREMMDELEAYWNSNSMILSLASILDPRERMACIEFYFPTIYGQDQSMMKIADVKANLRGLYEKFCCVADSESMSHI